MDEILIESKFVNHTHCAALNKWINSSKKFNIRYPKTKKFLPIQTIYRRQQTTTLIAFLEDPPF